MSGQWKHTSSPSHHPHQRWEWGLVCSHCFSKQVSLQQRGGLLGLQRQHRDAWFLGGGRLRNPGITGNETLPD